MSNLELWNKVEKTNPKYTKKAKISGHEITAIAPQYQIMQVTEQFGVYGQTWGFKNIELDYSLCDKFNLVVFKGTFFFPKGEFEIINSCKLYMDRNLTMVDDNFAKKIETDALTKAISKLGFNADIFLGKFEDVRYVAEMNNEFNPQPKPQPIVKKPLPSDKLEPAVELIKTKQKTKQFFLDNYELTEDQAIYINKY